MKRCDILCTGMALVDSIIRGFDPKPVSASGYRAVSGSLQVGGEAVNEALTAAKLGLRAGILCALGDDEAGELVLRALEKGGVDTSLVVRSAAHPTPVTTMFVREDGTRQSVTNRAHRYDFNPADFAEDFRGVEALLVGSLFRSPFDDPAVIFDTLSRASEAGCLIFADTKLPNFRPLTLHDIRDALPLVDCITPNEDEARYYTGREDPAEQAAVFLDHGVRNVLIKLGARGCYFRNEETALRMEAYRIDPVDATGAGDCMLAGFAAALIRGADLTDALRAGSACGAICTTAVGAGTALRDMAQVRALMDAQPDIAPVEVKKP